MNKKQKKQKNKQLVKKNSRKTKFYYSFLTVVLLICLIQVIRSAILNIYKTINYNEKIKKMVEMKEKVDFEHESLSNEIDNFSNMKYLESIARNKFKYSKEDEILVIINKQQEDLDAITLPEKEKTQKENTNIKNSVWIKFQEKLEPKKQNNQ